MKCERCGKELSGLDLYCERCGKAVFPEYMDEADIWAYYKTDEELAEILKAEEGQETKETKKSLWEAALLKEQETEAESLEPEAESETEVPKPEAELESEVPEPEPEAKPEVSEPEPESEIEVSESELSEPEPEVPELEVVSEAEVLEPDAEPEVETEPDAEHLETAQEETEEKEPQEETEDISEQEEWDFSDDDDEEEDEVPSLTPEMKKARRWKRALISLFLILCLGAGIFLGFHRIKKMEQQEKEYYKNIEGNTKQEAVSNEVPAEIPEEEKDTEPSEEETPVETETSAQTETPKEEPKQEYFKLVNADEIDFSKYQKLSAASTEENSVKESESYDYSAKSAVDGDVSTSWQENEEGAGEGKGFQVTLDGAHKIRYVVLHLGNWRSDQLWDYNARPKTLTIQVGDQQVKDVEFSNEKKKFCLSFDEPVEASYISLYIKEAYEGSRWQDNCISEVELYE